MKLAVVGDGEMVKTSTQIIKRVLGMVAADMRKDYLWNALVNGRGAGEGGGRRGCWSSVGCAGCSTLSGNSTRGLGRS